MVRRLVRSYGELVLIASLGLLAQAELWLGAEWAGHRRALSLIALAMTAVLFLRIRAPLVALVLQVGLVNLEAVVLSNANNDPMTLILLLQVAIYSAGAHLRGRRLAVAALVVAAATVGGMIEDGDSLNFGGALFFGFFIGGPFVAGLTIRIRREREGALAGERDERARAAVAEERTRIARELHDVVAHAISVIVVQARGARHAVRRGDPRGTRGDRRDRVHRSDGARRDAPAARRAARGRRARGARSAAGRLAAAGARGAGARAGVPVERSIEGEPVELPPGVDVSAYRIVQEALTNALKHAGAGACERRSSATAADALELEVVDDGAGSGDAADGSGHGLIGMRERVARLRRRARGRRAAPRAASRVRARLPLG